MKRRFLAIAFLLLIGCAVPFSVTNGKLDNIKSNIVDAISHTGPNAKPADVATAHKDLTISLPIVASVQSDVAAKDETITKLQDYQKAHENDWLGPRAHRLIAWIIGIVIVMGIGYVCLLVAGNMSGGWAATALGIVGHLFTAGIALVNSGLKKLAGKIFSTSTAVTPAT